MTAIEVDGLSRFTRLRLGIQRHTPLRIFSDNLELSVENIYDICYIKDRRVHLVLHPYELLLRKVSMQGTNR